MDEEINISNKGIEARLVRSLPRHLHWLAINWFKGQGARPILTQGVVYIPIDPELASDIMPTNSVRVVLVPQPQPVEDVPNVQLVPEDSEED